MATTTLLSVSTDLLILDIFNQYNHVICDLLHLASFTSHHVFKVRPCFSRCCYFSPLYGWVILHSMWINHILDRFTFKLSWIVLLWTFMSMFLLEYFFPILFGIYLEVELLNHLVILCLTFSGTVKLFPHSGYTIYIPTSDTRQFQFFHIPSNRVYFLLLFFQIVIIAILVSRKGYLIMILMLI